MQSSLCRSDLDFEAPRIGVPCLLAEDFSLTDLTGRKYYNHKVVSKGCCLDLKETQQPLNSTFDP